MENNSQTNNNTANAVNNNIGNAVNNNIGNAVNNNIGNTSTANTHNTTLAWAVDAACSGNPGPMEYRGIDLATGQQVFHFGPIRGTNNIGEFLAIVHALALMEQRGMKGYTIFSDSVNAQLWVRKMQCKTKLEHTPETEKAHQLVIRAENWLRTHAYRVPIVKWNTKEWGEIPADFGRK